METQNASITSTNLGVTHTDYGILSFYINLKYDGGGQGFGGWTLDDVPVSMGGDRLPTTLGSGLLLGIDTVFKCDWEGLPGKPCRVARRHAFGTIRALGHFLENRWLWLQELEEKEFQFVVTRFSEIEEGP